MPDSLSNSSLKRKKALKAGIYCNAPCINVGGVVVWSLVTLRLTLLDQSDMVCCLYYIWSLHLDL